MIKSHNPDAVGYIKPCPGKLAVATMVSNPARYKSRYRLYNGFAKHIEDSGADLFTCEIATGDREWEITTNHDWRNLQLRTTHELWHKENALNLMIARIPTDYDYIAWIDADVVFARPDWVQETIQQLQHFDVVQLFSHSVDLDPQFHPIDSAYGWIESIHQGFHFTGKRNGSGSTSTNTVKGAWHSGLAWAAKRTAFDRMGGLIDWAILGSADRNMGAGLFGHIEDTVDPSFHPEYRQLMNDWQSRCERHIRRNVGQVSGTLLHQYHGKKCHRGYTERWKILSKYQFNPRTDLKRDCQGLFELEDDHTPRFIGMRDAIRNYFRMRNEDSVEV